MKKRVIALMLAFVLVLNMGTVAFATGEGTPVPNPETEPTPTPAAEATPTPTPVVEETPTPTPAVDPTPTPTPAADPTPTSTPAVEATPTPTPTPEVVLASIRVTQMPDKLEYLCTDTAVDSTGGTLTLTFSDGTTQVVDLSAATLSLVKENANTASVNVAYEGMTDSFAVTVTHNYDEGTVTTEATATEPGVMTYTCADCGDEQIGEIPMAVATEIASGTCGAEGDNLTWTLNEDGVLTITGTGMMADYTDSNGECDSPWYIYRESINSIVIDGNITCIGNYAFYGCSKITNIAINSQIGPVGDYAFYGCSSLTSIVLPENVWRIGCYAFSGCNGLTSITMPASVRIYSEAFDGCSSITNATLTKGTGVVSDYTDNRSASVNYYGWTPWHESKQSSIMVTIGDEITHIGKNAFYYCDNLADLIMPASVSFGIQAFSGCTGIKNVLLTKGTGVMPYYGYTGDTQYSSTPWNVSKQSGITVTIEDGVTNIGENAFKYCDSLSSIFIPDSVKTIDTYAFYSCTELVNISMSGVTNIGEEAFFNCYKLTSILLPDSLTNIGEKAFSDCSKLTSITMPASARIREDAFNNCTNISNVTLTRGTGEMLRYTTGTSSGELRNISSYQWTPWYESEQNNITVTIEDGVNNIGKQAFYRCGGLTSISIPRSITSIGEEAFYNCSDLTAVHIDNLDCWVNISFHGSYTNPLTYAHNLYLDNMLVTDVSFPDGIAMVGNYTFAGATCIKTVSLPDSVASIADYAFGGCSGLTSITMPVSTDIYRYAFGGCTGVTSVTLTKGSGVMPDYTTSSSSSVTKNSYTFTPWYISRNNSITMTVETGITSLGSNTFYNCTGLSAVYVDSLDAWLNISFANNTSNPLSYAHDLYLNDALVTEVTFPADTTEVKPYVFAGGSCLTKINITDGIATIGTDAFKNCSALTEIEFEGNAPTTIDNVAFNGVTATAYYYKTKNWTEDDFQDYGGTITWKALAEVVASGTCGADGDNLTWTLDSDGVLTISGTGDMAYYSASNEAPWAEHRETITEIVLPEGITSIGDYAFADCSKVKEVIIPDSVISIYGGAFANCTELAYLRIPKSVKYITNTRVDGTNWNILDNYLHGCSKLITAGPIGSGCNIEYGWNMEIPHEAFWNCGNLESLHIASGITKIAEMAIYNNVNLESITVDESNTEYASIDGVLFTKDGKTLIKYPENKSGTQYSVPTGTMTIGENAFNNCDNLTKVTLNEGLTQISQTAFSDCSALSEMIIPDGVTNVGACSFYGCSALKSIVIPASVTVVASQSFGRCTALESITIPASVTDIRECAFEYCSALIEITFEGNAPTTIETTAFNGVTATAYYYKTKNWAEDDFQDYGGNITWKPVVEAIASGICGAEGDNLTWTLDSDGILTISGTGAMADYAFDNSNSTSTITTPWYIYKSNIKSIVIGDGVTSIGNHAFYDCRDAIGITIPDSVASIGDMAFASCSRLTSIAVPNGIASIGEGAFYYCTGLESIAIPSSVTVIGDYAFRECSNLTSITMPNNIASIGEGMFYCCNSLTDVAIPSSVKSIGDFAFNCCNSLTSIDIPSGVKNIGTEVFLGCSELSSVTMPDSITSLGDYAFDSCVGLTNITIPSSVTNIGYGTFYDCTSLNNVIFACDAPEIRDNAFTNVTATVKYLHTKNWPEDKLQDYGGTLTWQLCCENFEECEVITDEAIEPTFNSTGLTEGSHCSVCEKPIVAQNELPKLAVTELEITAPDKLVYYKGESLDSTGLTVTAKLNNDTIIDVTDQVQLEGFSSSTAGTKTVTVSYNDAQAIFDVQVFSFTGVSLSLDGRVILNFYASFPGRDTVGYTPGILFFRQQPGDGEIERAYAAGEGITRYAVGNDGTLMFNYDKLAAKELNDKVYATLYAVQDDGKVVFGTPTPISAADYAVGAFNQYSDEPLLQTLMVDMLNFGAAAQNEFDYRTDALANSNMSTAMAAKGTKENVSLSNGMKLYNDSLSSDKATIKEASLSLDNEISINFYAEIKGDIKKAELLIFDGYTAGGVYDKTTASKRTDMIPHGDMYAGFIRNIAAKSMRDLYYARVYVQFEDGTEAYSGIGQYSVESYAWQVRNGSGFSSELKLLMEEMMKYGDSAKMYMENKNNNANG